MPPPPPFKPSNPTKPTTSITSIPTSRPTTSTPFCCLSAIPSHTSYLLALLPPSQLHTTCTTNASTALLTSFLAATYLFLPINDSSTTTSNFPSPPRSYTYIISTSHSAISTPNLVTAVRWFVLDGDLRNGNPTKGGKSNVDVMNCVAGTLVKGWTFVEVERRVADESIRPEGCGIVVGDGETWREVEGGERVVCADHKAIFAVRAWRKVD